MKVFLVIGALSFSFSTCARPMIEERHDHAHLHAHSHGGELHEHWHAHAHEHGGLGEHSHDGFSERSEHQHDALGHSHDSLGEHGPELHSAP